MKIYYIANVRIPTEKAHGIQIMKMCEALSAHGKVELVLPKRKSQQYENIDPFSFYGVKRTFAMTTLRSLDPYWLMKLPQGIYIKFQILFFLFRLFIYLALKKKKEEYILYTRDEYILPVLEWFSKKVVWEAHNIPRNKNYYVKYWKECNTIIVLTSYIKRELIGMGIDEKKIFVASDGVDIKSFSISMSKNECRKKLDLTLEKKIVLYTGHFYEWKGAQVLADAAQYLPEYFFVFVGGTSHDKEQFIKHNSQYKNINIIGHQPQEMIPYFLSAADILVLPNSAKSDISRFYTSPLKFFEYLSTGKPIVASDLPSLHEIGDEFDGIFYFKPDDSRDLAQVIKKVDIDKHYQRDLHGFTWKARVDKILKFIVC